MDESKFTAYDIQRILEPKRWIFAKTMPDNPHHYTLRREWGEDSNLFSPVVQYIYDNGTDESYEGRWYKVLYLSEYKYWAMGWPADETTLINRKRANQDQNIDIQVEISGY